METPNFQRSISIKLWPPSQSTRVVLVERIVNNLSTPSIFSKRYANEHYEREPDGDGSSAVQLYAKESSKLMMEVLKRGPQIVDREVSVDKDIPSTLKTVFYISKGKRANIEAEEAEELLRPLAEENPYTKICFSNRSFSVDAARVAEPILLSLKDQLKEVDMSDIVAGKPEEEALEVMRIFSSALEDCVLRYLNLSENALGEKCAGIWGSPEISRELGGALFGE
ncbi:hypothetical protein IFM89_019970 [Coptis chinensis]|uniref:WPP domain-containing protein n=1 Tax=Coptis chinensis TaxID=261450 RepID=A0A835LWG8_9MAGN|nr:hypothetical protein IFM89_019970 [Coptis chinensis]